MSDASITFGPYRSARQIICATCDGTGISPEEAIGQSRKPCMVEIRSRIAKALKAELGWGTSRIGRAIGNRDHATAFHALRRPHRDINALPPLFRSKAKVTPVELPAIVVPAIHPSVTHAPPIPVDPDAYDGRETPLQRSCRASTIRLIAEHGSCLYAPFNVRGERSQLGRPPFV